MKKMLNPEIEWIKFSVKDVIMSSPMNEQPINQPGEYTYKDEPDTNKEYDDPVIEGGNLPGSDSNQ